MTFKYLSRAPTVKTVKISNSCWRNPVIVSGVKIEMQNNAAVLVPLRQRLPKPILH